MLYLIVDVFLSGGYFLESLADLLVQLVQVDFGVRESGINTILVSVHLLIVCSPVLAFNDAFTDSKIQDGILGQLITLEYQPLPPSYCCLYKLRNTA